MSSDASAIRAAVQTFVDKLANDPNCVGSLDRNHTATVPRGTYVDRVWVPSRTEEIDVTIGMGGTSGDGKAHGKADLAVAIGECAGNQSSGNGGNVTANGIWEAAAGLYADHAQRLRDEQGADIALVEAAELESARLRARDPVHRDASSEEARRQ